MKIIFQLIFAFFIILSYVSCECYEKLDSNKEFTFLSRDEGGNNGWNTYFDNLLLDKATAKSWSIKKYISIAKQYKDTVKADKPVSNVCFYGIKSCSTPIYAGSDNMRDYEIIDITFKDIIEQDKNENATIRTITIWKGEGNFVDYSADEITVTKGGNLSWMKLPAATIKNMFDSLQRSTVPIGQIIEKL